VILLTGSTGALGASALTQFVDDPKVSRIYAINRRSSASLIMRQKDGLLERGFDASYADSPKVILLEADFSKPNFGFERSVFEEVRTSITHIAHFAWQINLTVGLDAYEGDIRGARHLIDLALSSPLPNPPRFLFTSSVSILHSECVFLKDFWLR
jgi:thioester reductase-like protein